MTTTQVAVRLPSSLLTRVDDLVGTVHTSRSEVIRRALDLYVYRLDCERDAQRYDQEPLSDRELAFGDDADALAAAPEW